MKYSAKYQVFAATFHVLSWKVDFLWDSAALDLTNNFREAKKQKKWLYKALICSASAPITGSALYQQTIYRINKSETFTTHSFLSAETVLKINKIIYLQEKRKPYGLT